MSSERERIAQALYASDQAYDAVHSPGSGMSNETLDQSGDRAQYEAQADAMLLLIEEARAAERERVTRIIREQRPVSASAVMNCIYREGFYDALANLAVALRVEEQQR